MSGQQRKPYYLAPLVVGVAALLIDVAVTSRSSTPLPLSSLSLFALTMFGMAYGLFRWDSSNEAASHRRIGYIFLILGASYVVGGMLWNVVQENQSILPLPFSIGAAIFVFGISEFRWKDDAE